MANEISWRHGSTGKTLYFTIRDAANRQYYNGSTFEALTVANWGNYDIALSEAPASSYFYAGDFPFLACGWYFVDIFERAGGSPAIGDILIGSMYGYWCQSKFEPAGGDMKQIASDTDKATALKNALNSVNNHIQSNLTYVDGTAVSKSAGGLLSVNTEEIKGAEQTTGDVYAEINGVQQAVNLFLGSDNKVLISTDDQNLSTTLHVDGGGGGSTPEQIVSAINARIVDGAKTGADLDKIMLASIIGEEEEAAGTVTAYLQDGTTPAFSNTHTNTTREPA